MKNVLISAPALCWLALGVILVWALFVPAEDAGDSLGLRRFLTVEVGREWRIGQRFRMNRPGLSAIEIQAAAVGPVAGRYELILSDQHAPDITRHVEVDAADLVRDEGYVFRFTPIRMSAGHDYLLELSASSEEPGRGIALWATKGERLAEGGLLINGRQRWATLAFQTHTPESSPFTALTQTHDADRPPRWLALIGLAGLWISLGFVLSAFPIHVLARTASPQPVIAAASFDAVATAERLAASGATPSARGDQGVPPAEVR